MERDLAREYADHCADMYDKRLHDGAPESELQYWAGCEDGSRAWTNGQEKTLISRGFIVNAWMELPKRYEKDELVSGETIQCHGKEDLQVYQEACKRAGIETDKFYEMHGEKGFRLRVR